MKFPILFFCLDSASSMKEIERFRQTETGLSSQRPSVRPLIVVSEPNTSRVSRK